MLLPHFKLDLAICRSDRFGGGHLAAAWLPTIVPRRMHELLSIKAPE